VNGYLTSALFVNGNQSAPISSIKANPNGTTSVTISLPLGGSNYFPTNTTTNRILLLTFTNIKNPPSETPTQSFYLNIQRNGYLM
jgi:hypothetical protein